jgi:hypothetical protein
MRLRKPGSDEQKLIFLNICAAVFCDHPVMFESHSDGHGLGDLARCPICDRRTKRVRTIARTFQDDLEVWKCRSCGTSVTQTVNLAKHLAKREQQARGSTHLN